MPIVPVDERPHLDGPTERWSLAFVLPDGVAGRVAATRHEGTVAVSILLLRRDAGPIVVRDVIATRAEPFELRGEGIWMNQHCETPFEHWSYGLEAFGVELDRPQDAWDGELGTRVALGWDLEWERTAAPFDLGSGYVQPGVVHGELLIDDITMPCDGFGVRGHQWGAVTSDAALWWHDNGGDTVVVGERAVRWDSDRPEMVTVRGYDSTVDTRGFPSRVDLTLGATDASFDINPFAWAAEIVEERPLRIVPHTAFTVSRAGVVIGGGWETGTS